MIPKRTATTFTFGENKLPVGLPIPDAVDVAQQVADLTCQVGELTESLNLTNAARIAERARYEQALAEDRHVMAALREDRNDALESKEVERAARAERERENRGLRADLAIARAAAVAFDPRPVIRILADGVTKAHGFAPDDFESPNTAEQARVLHVAVSSAITMLCTRDER